tara:strand:+ start:2106 stop:2276 length:171 start_codon:yes stop_codon:yes gene_type:complete
MKIDDLGHTIWQRKDFTKHGYIATYVLGKCRCDICKTRYKKWIAQPEGRLPARYNF